MSLSEDEKILISAGKDRIIRLWDVNSNKLIHSLRGHTDTITVLLVDIVVGS